MNYRRYEKHILLSEIDFAGQQKINNAKVAVLGAGGLGCPILQYLNAAGVGSLGIIDFDIIEESNLHRQILYTHNDIGNLKAETAKKYLELQNTETTFKLHIEKLTSENAIGIFKDYDIVVDGTDNFSTRYACNDACVLSGKPLVYGSIFGFEGQLATFNYKNSKNLRDIFPEPPPKETVPNCTENGVMSTFPGIIGTMMAQEVLKIILGLMTLSNKLLIFNTKEWEMRILNY